MTERSCWTCLRFPDCDRVRSKGRKYRLYNAPHRLFDSYRSIAENCEAWEEDSAFTAQMVANELLKKIVRALEEGKVVVLNRIGHFSFLGEYSDENQARSAVNENHNVILLKAVLSRNPNSF